LIFIRTGKKISTIEGLILLFLYFSFVLIQVIFLFK
jgi:Ca2+/Na+ antiporter